MAEIVLGPVIGGLSHDGVKLWARADGPGMLHAWVGQAPDLSDAQRAGAALLVASSGFAARVPVQGLQPETTYHYALTLTDTPPSPQGAPYPAFTTAPLPGTITDFTFAFGSCFLPGKRYDGAVLRQIDALRSSRDLRFLLMLGDQIYADVWGGNGIGRVALTENDYRAVYLHTWGHPAWRGLMQNMPVFMTLDDHEVDDDWAWTSSERYAGRIPGYHVPKRWIRGYPPEARRLSHRRIQAAIQTYWEHQAMHAPDLLHPPEGVEYDRPQLLPSDEGNFAYTFTYGPAAFFVMDTRTQRIHGQRMLNRVQWEALETWLLDVKDRFPVKFIVSSVSVLYEMWGDTSLDRWNGYPDERRRLLHLLTANHIQGVYILSGDLHTAHAVETVLRTPGGGTMTLWEFCSSPFEQVPNKIARWLRRRVRVHPVVRQQVHFHLAEPNVGLVQITFSEKDATPKVRFEVYDSRGNMRHHVDA